MADRSGASPRGLVAVLTTAAFFVFGQAFMIAPILPRLASVLHTSTGVVGLAVPAYLLPYGVASLVWGPVTDRVGRRPVIFGCLVAFVLVTAATATATDAQAFIAWRAIAGLVASGIVPVSVALIADVLPYEVRGRALGWIFGGMAGGMAVGAAAGALAEPVIGWRGLFLVVAGAAALVTVWAAMRVPAVPARPGHADLVAVLRGYVELLRRTRARRVYLYVGVNAILQSGVYTWLGVYLHERFALGTAGIGLSMLGYGIPGLVFGPLIGRLADRHGRSGLVPLGVAVTAAATLLLAAPVPHSLVNPVIAVLSLGYDLTQPLLAGIVTDLPGPPGQAVALMAVILFCGFGAGSLLFQAILPLGFPVALIAFGSLAVLAAGLAVPSFHDERPAAER